MSRFSNVFTPAEDAYIVKLKGMTPVLSWAEIAVRFNLKFPARNGFGDRTKGGLQVRYSRNIKPTISKNNALYNQLNNENATTIKTADESDSDYDDQQPSTPNPSKKRKSAKITKTSSEDDLPATFADEPLIENSKDKSASSEPPKRQQRERKPIKRLADEVQAESQRRQKLKKTQPGSVTEQKQTKSKNLPAGTVKPDEASKGETAELNNPQYPTITTRPTSKDTTAAVAKAPRDIKIPKSRNESQNTTQKTDHRGEFEFHNLSAEVIENESNPRTSRRSRATKSRAADAGPAQIKPVPTINNKKRSFSGMNSHQAPDPLDHPDTSSRRYATLTPPSALTAAERYHPMWEFEDVQDGDEPATILTMTEERKASGRNSSQPSSSSSDALTPVNELSDPDQVGTEASADMANAACGYPTSPAKQTTTSVSDPGKNKGKGKANANQTITPDLLPIDDDDHQGAAILEHMAIDAHSHPSTTSLSAARDSSPPPTSSRSGRNSRAKKSHHKPQTTMSNVEISGNAWVLASEEHLEHMRTFHNPAVDPDIFINIPESREIWFNVRSNSWKIKTKPSYLPGVQSTATQKSHLRRATDNLQEAQTTEARQARRPLPTETPTNERGRPQRRPPPPKPENNLKSFGRLHFKGEDREGQNFLNRRAPDLQGAAYEDLQFDLFRMRVMIAGMS